jgi:GH25 family lysozyme M1 (1,4-beta-N-acetylmuramidase)
MDIKYQYSWRFVGTFEEGKRETLLKSGRWFLNQDDCVYNAETNRDKVSIYQASIELKIVQRPLYITSVDELENGQRLQSLENSLKILFAEEVYHSVKHSSHTTSEIHAAVDSVNVDTVIDRWLAYVDSFELNLGLHPIYSSKYLCKDWLTKEYKCDEWKREITRIIADKCG